MRYYEKSWPEGLSLAIYSAAGPGAPRGDCALTREAARSLCLDSTIPLEFIDQETQRARCEKDEIDNFPTTLLLLNGSERARTQQTFFTWVQMEHWVRDQLRDGVLRA
jgi:hypothetical protein